MEQKILTTKEQGFRMVISTMVSLIIVVPSIWFLLKPTIADSLAEETRAIVQQEISPLSDAFEVMMQARVEELRTQISDSEFKHDQADDDPDDELIWTQQDNRTLTVLRTKLASSQAALEALKSGQRENAR